MGVPPKHYSPRDQFAKLGLCFQQHLKIYSLQVLIIIYSSLISQLCMHCTQLVLSLISEIEKATILFRWVCGHLPQHELK